jgi:hypothetical protein
LILPTKYLLPQDSLLFIGGQILRIIGGETKTVSRTWAELTQARRESGYSMPSFDWYILALDLLYMLQILDFSDGRLSRRSST